jgi:hypothetical protein
MAPAPAPVGPQPVIPALARILAPELEQHLPAQLAKTRKSLSEAATGAADFERKLIVQGLTDPWGGLAAFEHVGLQMAQAARSGSLSAFIGLIEAATGRRPPSFEAIPVPAVPEAEALTSYLLAVLQQAAALRQQAVRKLTPLERQFLFDHPAALIERFSPQVSGEDDQGIREIEADRRFYHLVSERLDFPFLIAAAQAVARLGEERFLQALREGFQKLAPQQSPVQGITGDLMAVRETPMGLVVIGGPGSNVYDLDRRVVLIVDLGGDDQYRGMIASPAAVEQGISVIIDLAGHDTYRAAPLGLATGRLGVGMLIDRTGDDQYELAPGSGGAGLGGVGVLDDGAGNDQYVGSKVTQGSALGGLGLLIDRAGTDTFTGFGYAIGFGGPLGVGVVVDGSGDDRYQCGNRYPSASNALDNPEAKPGDARFQYDCFGMGAGSGTRIQPKGGARSFAGLAGGLGILLDLAGDDDYHSANFSQGTGYFFGAGLKLDLAGNDRHAAARYGHAAAAHEGLGVFIDYAGDDEYTSTGPVYNGGVAWDRSVALCLDAGAGNDRYDLRRSDGLGRADHSSFGLFVEEGGRDRYAVLNGMGKAVDNSVSAFFDLAGEDDYTEAGGPGPGERGNRRILEDPPGGLFEDK